MENDSLIQLIKIAIVSPDRKRMYIEAVGNMSAEEKLSFGIDLWERVLEKATYMAQAKLELMIENMSENGEEYTETDFINVREQILHDLMKRRLRVVEDSDIAHLRAQLAELPLN